MDVREFVPPGHLAGRHGDAERVGVGEGLHDFIAHAGMKMPPRFNITVSFSASGMMKAEPGNPLTSAIAHSQVFLSI